MTKVAGQKPPGRTLTPTSLVARANPLVLLAIGLLAIPASIAIRDLTIGIISLAAYVFAGIVLVPSLRQALGRFFAVSLACLTIIYSTWLLGGHHIDTAVTAGIRILVLALPGSVLAAFIDPARLADQLGQRLRLPARPVVAFSAALQRFELLGQTWQQLDRARRARGYGPTRNPVAIARHAAGMTFGLLVASMRDATQMSVAMDARGFATAQHRTWAEPAPWLRLDTALLSLGIVLAAVPVLLTLLSIG